MKADRASLTATKVGRIVLYLHHHPQLRAVLPPRAGELTEQIMLKSGLAKEWMLRFYEQGWWERFLDWVEEHTIPGQTLAYGLRKRFIDAETRIALEHGATQVVNVGAGLDTLCPRLSEDFPGGFFLELDLPAGQQTKGFVLQELRMLRPGRLRLLPVDLSREPLQKVLSDCPEWDSAARSVVVAEAVLMYLREADVRAFFRQARASVAPGSTLLFTWLRRDEESGQIWLGEAPGMMKASMGLIGEPLVWAIKPSELPAMLAESGWRLVDEPARLDLKSRFLEPLGLQDQTVGGIELLAVAEAV